MAQTGYTPILIYSSSTGGNAPAAGNLTNSTLGSELAINITDGKLFYKDNANAVQVIGWKITPTTAGGTGLTSYTAGDLLYYASGTTLSKLAIGTSGQWLGSSGSAPQWNSPAALTKTDDTNVTLTLGGSASTALLNAASLTLGWTGQLAASRGGTGIGSYTAGDLLYASNTTTLSKLADVATGNALISGGVGVAPSWGKIGLTTHISGTLPTANGGTNLTSFTANGVMYASSTSALATSSAFTWDGTTHALTANGSGFKAMTGSDSANYYAGFLANYSYGEVLRFYVKGGSVAESTILSWGEGAGLTINNGGASAPVIVKAANSEVARFFASGGVSIGNTTDPGASNLSVTGNILGGSGKSFIANGNRTYYSAAGFWDDTVQGNACGVGCFGGPAIGPLNGSGSATDNTVNLGSATYRWKTVYAGTSTINTSDANEKQDIASLDDAELAVAKQIKSLIKKFKFKDAVQQKGDLARIHFGVIAQEIESAFAEQNLDASKYGLFCRDEWYEVDGKSMDENMVPYTADTDLAVKKTRLGVRYEELFAFVIAAM